MDTEKQRQRRRDDARLTESGNARSEQLSTRGAYSVANEQSSACLSGSERRRPGWFLDMKYQTCSISRYIVYIVIPKIFRQHTHGSNRNWSDSPLSFLSLINVYLQYMLIDKHSLTSYSYWPSKMCKGIGTCIGQQRKGTGRAGKQEE